MSNSVILNEEIDEDYEPNEDELLEYAKFLGMEFPEDEEYLYIAREGLKAPLPEPWKPCQTKGGDIYFFNFDSGQSVWEHPCDTYYKDQFTEAKNKKKYIVKKPPLQESKERQKKAPVTVLPKSVSPVGFEKKRDLLSEIIQLEKEMKEKKAELKDQLEKELMAQNKEFNLQRDIDIKNFKEQMEKESKKKVNQMSIDLENVEGMERKSFELRLNEKIKEIAQETEKTIADEKQKVQERVEKELLVFVKEQISKKDKSLETAKLKSENERKNLLRQIEEQKELHERQLKTNTKLDENLKEEYMIDEMKLNKKYERDLEEFKKDQEYEVQKAAVSARNRKSQVTLHEKLRELREEYKVKEEVEKRNAKREFEDEIKDLYKDLNTSCSQIEKDMHHHERNKELDELSNRYKIKKREEMLKIDQEIEKTLNMRKEILDQEWRDKINMFKPKQPKVNSTEIEQKSQDLFRESTQARDKVNITEQILEKMKLITEDLKQQLTTVRIDCETPQGHFPSSERIKELRQQLAVKDQELERLRNNNPNKLATLENEIRDMKEMMDPIHEKNERPVLHYEERVGKCNVKQVQARKNPEKNLEEELEEPLNSDEEMLVDWRKEDSWNISRDISPVVQRNQACKRPQYSTRAWVKPRDNSGRFSAGRAVGAYLY